MRHCDLELTGRVLYEMRCKVCGVVVTSRHDDPSKRRHDCVGLVPEEARPLPAPPPSAEPSVIRRAVALSWSLAQAEAAWIAAGKPVRSAEEIEEIYETQCQPCEYFKPGRSVGRGSCGQCGCALRKAGGVLNKIKMATEHCPAGKW